MYPTNAKLLDKLINLQSQIQMFYSTSVLAILSYLALARGDYTPQAIADEVTNLPGAEKLTLNFRQFSGYLDVSSTKHMHYWFVESSNNPSTDPVAFWTNGGA